MIKKKKMKCESISTANGSRDAALLLQVDPSHRQHLEGRCLWCGHHHWLQLPLVNYLGTVDHNGDHVNEAGAKKAKRFHFGADDHEYDADNNLNDDDANDDDKEDNDELHLGAVDLLLPTPAAFLWPR